MKELDILGPCILWFHLYRMSITGKSIETKGKWVTTEGGEWLVTCRNLSVQWWNVLELHHGDGCMAWWINRKPLNYVLKKLNSKRKNYSLKYILKLWRQWITIFDIVIANCSSNTWYIIFDIYNTWNVIYIILDNC